MVKSSILPIGCHGKAYPMVKTSAYSVAKLSLALAALVFIFLTAFDSVGIQASTPSSKIPIEIITQTETVTTTVTSSCHPITGPAGRTYCGPLFDLLGYTIDAHNNSASVELRVMYTETEINSAQFSDQGTNYNLACRSSSTTGSVFDRGQVVTCSASGFSPPITRSDYNYAMSINANNPGDTELFLTQTWGASYLQVTQ
jgi:hypothetical protein